ncbi:hypothetical protein BaRGS_00030675 [Batillaria attramentaria]|uniref:UBX domain-containing protein 11 n=1 Tax=Batillaria attramentaria TaxID=370345 RepID=A0ABD0JST0_9CAEN
MSSPLSSLKKGGRHTNFLPGHIPGHRPIPFRHPEYSEDESKLLEEITTSMAASRIQARDPFSGGLPRMDESPNPSLLTSNNNADHQGGNSSDSESGALPPTNQELMKLMMARLALMEQKVQKQEREITEKDRRIKVLEEKLHIMGKARADDKEGNCNNSGRVSELEEHCLLLQQQVHEMETFLADYGMVWVGEQDDPDSNLYLPDSDATSSDTKSSEGREQVAGPSKVDLDDWSTPVTKGRGEPFNIDFDLLLANIRDLNVIAGEGEARVQRTVDGARLKRPDPIPLTLYSNGIIMFEGPFRPYSDPTTVQCVQDFLDGYFPSELQRQYPDGVPFLVRDMRDVFFRPQAATSVFSGTGMTLGGEEQPSRLIPTLDTAPLNTNLNTSPNKHQTVTSKPPHRQVSPAVFLNKLPKSVIRDGKVIDIRDSVGKTLMGQNNSSGGADKLQITVVETAVTKSMQKTIAQAKSPRPKTPRDITTLRIKSETGSHTYILKMKFQETIRDLRHYLNKHRAGQGTDYDIYSTYPRKHFSDDKATMEGCGLIPNAVLYLHPKKKG